MSSEDIYPILPVWALRQMFYTLVGIPLSLIFIGVFWLSMLNGSKDWVRPAIYIAMFVGVRVVSLPFNFIYDILKIKNFHYIIDRENITIKEGIIQKQTRTINYSAIQMVSLRQGLFDRIANLATVQIENASEGGGQYMILNKNQQAALNGSLGSFYNIVTIPGLNIDDAQKLKQIILNKIRTTSTMELGI